MYFVYAAHMRIQTGGSCRTERTVRTFVSFLDTVYALVPQQICLWNKNCFSCTCPKHLGMSIKTKYDYQNGKLSELQKLPLTEMICCTIHRNSWPLHAHFECES